MRRKCSLRIPERMAERVTGVGAWDSEYEQALVADVCHDDLGLVRVRIPLERDRVISVLACVQFDEHERLLSGSGHRACETSVRGGMRLQTAGSVGVRGTARRVTGSRARE